MSSRLSPGLAEFAESRRPGGRDPRDFDARGMDPRSMEPPLHPSELDRFETGRWPMARWIPVTIVHFLVVFSVGVGTTLAWQSYGNAARRMVASLSPGLGWLTPPAAPESHAVAPAAVSPDQAAALSRSLAAVRQSVDRLAADIGKLQPPKPDPAARPPASPAATSSRRPGATAQVQPAQAR